MSEVQPNSELQPKPKAKPGLGRQIAFYLFGFVLVVITGLAVG